MIATPHNKDERDELLVAEALGVADARERGQLDSLLKEDADARARLIELRDAAAMLAFSAAPVEPSPDVRARLLSSLNEQKDAPDNNNESGASNVVGINSLPAPAVTSRNVFMLPRSTVVFASLAASVMFAALCGLAFVLWQRTNATQAQLSNVQAELRQRESQAAQTNQELARLRADSDLLAAPQSRITELKGTPNAPAARARVVFDPQTKRAMLYSHALPPAPAGKAYQIWYITGGKPLPGGVFTATNANNEIALRETAPAGSNATSTFAVTLEAAGGAQTPQGEFFLSAKIRED